MLGGVVYTTLRTFLADNAGIAFPLGIERVIWLGSNNGGLQIESSCAYGGHRQ